MANWVEEGQNTNKQFSDETEDAATSNWLKSNKLTHLVSIFAEENITIDELKQMNTDALDKFLESLANDKDIPKFKHRDKIRIEQRLKSNKQSHIQRVIITEAETSAMKSLDDKLKELLKEQKSIESAINKISKAHNQVNDSFNEIISNIEKRRKILLNDINGKITKYKNELNKQLKYNANKRSNLIKTKNQYEYNINESAKLSSSAIASSDVVRQRANKNVAMIDEILLNMNELYKHKSQSKHILFEMNKSEIINDTKSWGKVVMKGDKVSAPKVQFMWASRYPGDIQIEILLDENVDIEVTKYEIELYEGKLDEKQVEHMNENEIKKFQVDVIDDNIAYYKFGRNDLRETDYMVRVRAMLDKQQGQYSNWMAFRTCDGIIGSIYMDHVNTKETEYWNKYMDPQHTGHVNLFQWLASTQNMNMGFSEYQRKRMFYGIALSNNKMEKNQFKRFFPSSDWYRYEELDKCNTDWKNFHRKLQSVVSG